jgi:hypothetical protein
MQTAENFRSSPSNPSRGPWFAGTGHGSRADHAHKGDANSGQRNSKVVMNHGRHFIGIDCLLARQPFKCDYKFTVIAATQLEKDRAASPIVIIPGDADVVVLDLIQIHKWNQSKNSGSKSAANIIPEVDLRDAAHGNDEALTMLHEDDFPLVNDDLDGLV